MAPAAKRRRVDRPSKASKNGSPATNKADRLLENAAFSRHADDWDVEQEYESRKRPNNLESSSRLPLKHADGRIEHTQLKDMSVEDVALSESSFGSGSIGDETPLTDEAEADSELVTPKISKHEAERQAQEELSKIAEQLQVAPEEHIALLKRLEELASGAANSRILSWALGTQLAVYRDLIPGYRIRPLGEEDMRAKLSKDVRRQRQFEQSIVRGYQNYVERLARIANVKKSSGTQQELWLAAIAVGFASKLLEAAPHFNFRTEILRILVNRLATKKIDGVFMAARSALEHLFESDEEGHASLEAVGMLSKMLKAKDYLVDESVLNTLLHLRLLSELVVKGSNNKVDQPEEDDRPRLKGKKAKQAAWEHRSKKERKLVRERKAIEKEMKEADAQVGYEERDKNQSETLKIVFTIYLRILKARSAGLMGAVLEGLVKYAHLINQDFFGDLLESLRELIIETETSDTSVEDQDEIDDTAADDAHESEAARNFTRESLLCVSTAFALLQGQDVAAAASSLHLDLDFFIQHLYRTLYPVALNADLELSAKSLRAPDPNESDEVREMRTKVNVQTTIVLLLRSLQAVLLPPSNPRAVPPVRLAAFTHHIMTGALQMPEKSTVAVLGLMNQTAKQHKKKVASLWNTEERRGNGNFDPASAELEGSNPFAGTIWEGELLKLHYAPVVREGAANLEKLMTSTQ